MDGLQVRLPDSETPGGTGYLGKEERAGEKGQKKRVGRWRETRRKHDESTALGSPHGDTAQGAVSEPYPTQTTLDYSVGRYNYLWGGE